MPAVHGVMIAEKLSCQDKKCFNPQLDAAREHAPADDFSLFIS
jgi:hypothetical protein